MIVDGLFSTIGSINFDMRSMSKNAEESLSFYDRPFAELMEAMFERNRLRCHEITLDVGNDRSAATRFAQSVSWIWEPYY